MKRNRFVIVGLGGIGTELIKKLSREIDLTCIDLDPEAGERVVKVRPDVRVVTGDATSRLVLEEAGVADADGVIITTTSERVNVEVARVLKEHFDAERVISVGNTEEGIKTLEELGVEVENIFTASAIGIRNRLERKSRAAHAIGLAKDEILEVEVHPNSKLANKPIGSLVPIRWRIGIIYRDDNIIVPRKETVLRPKDRVVILGDPAVLKTVAEILTFSFERFPLEYGPTAIAYLTGSEDERFFDEMDYLLSVFPLDRAVFIYSGEAARRADLFKEYSSKDHLRKIETRETTLPPLGAVQDVIAEVKASQGLVVLSKAALMKSRFPFLLDSRKKRFLTGLSNLSLCPVLLAAGTFPYERVLVPCIEGVDIQRVLEASFEIAASLHNEVTAVLVRPSKYISADEELEGFEERRKAISEMSLMYKASIGVEVLEGNPVRAVTGIAAGFNLMITGTGGWKDQGFLSSLLNPDPLWHIIRGAGVSTLLIPAVEESL